AALVANGKMALAEKKNGESAKLYEMAEQKLDALTDLVKLKRETSSTTERERLNAIPFGFNEWFKAQNKWFKGQNKTQEESLTPQDEWFKAKNSKHEPIMGHNWQTWSAAMYLYAVKCVETGKTPFFDEIRGEESS
ncbi:MAG TPA: hypothetical protein VK186_26555, partial [Candidatus Deferrimicrobium sp.]|nr:hypothetical protein [Candidatus Deferrimicrobium sp.]